MENRTRGINNDVWDTSKPITSLVLGGGINNDVVVCEILSRLPVKSLARFKCVSKGWLNLVEEDSYFIDLHLARSKARQSLLCVSSSENRRRRRLECMTLDEFLLTPDLSLEGLGRSTIKTTNQFCCDDILGPVNGLICLVDKGRYAVCIYNISTREASPWIESTLLLDEKKKHPKIETWGSHHTTYAFGFDPATKVHKVLLMLHINIEQPTDDDDSDIDSDDGHGDEICEILSLGNGTWRRIDEVSSSYVVYSPRVYVNGSIYWCTYTSPLLELWQNYPTGITAFDVGTEKFRMIEIPCFIRDQPLDPDEQSKHPVRLVELDGRVGILCRESAHALKLWTFDDNKMGKRTPSMGNVGDGIWTDETIKLPFAWDKYVEPIMCTVIGTCQILLLICKSEFKVNMKCISLHLYDRKEKSFTKIKSNGGSSSGPDNCWMKHFSPFVESLIRVQKQRSNSGVLNSNL